MGRSHSNQKHIKMQIVCKSLFTKYVQNVHHLHGHMRCLEMLSPLVSCCSVNNFLSEIGPQVTAIEHSFSSSSVHSAVVDTLLYHCPHHVVDWIYVGAVRWP